MFLMNQLLLSKHSYYFLLEPPRPRPPPPLQQPLEGRREGRLQHCVGLARGHPGVPELRGRRRQVGARWGAHAEDDAQGLLDGLEARSDLQLKDLLKELGKKKGKISPVLGFRCTHI